MDRIQCFLRLLIMPFLFIGVFLQPVFQMGWRILKKAVEGFRHSKRTFKKNLKDNWLLFKEALIKNSKALLTGKYDPPKLDEIEGTSFYRKKKSKEAVLPDRQMYDKN